MPASLSELTSDLRRHARMLYSTDLTAQLEWLRTIYLDLAADRLGGEATTTSFEGQAVSFAFRNASPEDQRLAVGAAYDELESQIAGEVANSQRRPFGITFAPGRAPHELLG